jgi:hypothetical protein
MEIIVTADKTLQAISEEFNAKFPYLKLEFYAHTHEPGSGNPRSDRIDSKLTVKEAGEFEHDENMSINGNLKVSTLEQHFQDLFGIGVQVLRKSGPVWLQTTTTDEWTLGKQNTEGREDSLPVS